MNRIDSPKLVTGASQDEDLVVVDSLGSQWILVSADAFFCFFEAIEPREIGYDPRIRSLPTAQVEALVGRKWAGSFVDDFNIELDDADMMADITANQHSYVRDLGDGARVRLVEACDAAFIIAEPIWLYANATEHRDAFESDLYSCVD